MAAFNSLDEAWKSQIRTIRIPDDCPICYEPFAEDHRPVHFVGSNECTHVFGDTCLRIWLEANDGHRFNCLMCRSPWFDVLAEDEDWISEQDLEEDTIEQEQDSEQGNEGYHPSLQGSDDEDWRADGEIVDIEVNTLENLRNRETAGVFVDTLYEELRRTETDATEMDLKECVQEALLEADLHASSPISDELWGKICRMVKRMLRDSKKTDWDDDTERNWIRRVARALNLQFER